MRLAEASHYHVPQRPPGGVVRGRDVGMLAEREHPGRGAAEPGHGARQLPARGSPRLTGR